MTHLGMTALLYINVAQDAESYVNNHAQLQTVQPTTQATHLQSAIRYHAAFHVGQLEPMRLHRLCARIACGYIRCAILRTCIIFKFIQRHSSNECASVREAGPSQRVQDMYAKTSPAGGSFPWRSGVEVPECWSLILSVWNFCYNIVVK